MLKDIAAGARYARSWLTGNADVVASEVELDRGDRTVPATVILPARHRGSLPGWVLLHGATVPGREHAQLVRFARSMAHSGAAVIIPEVPEWRTLALAPGLTLPTVRAAVPALRARPEVAARPVGVVGFSFGAPHAVVAAGDPALASELAGVVAFGGYCDLPRTLRFLFLGEHEWNGERFTASPDPYGRWIVGGNYLHQTPGYEDAADVAEALRELAARAGASGLPAGDRGHDAVKDELARRVDPRRRALFAAFAPPAGTLPDRAQAERLVADMAAAIRRVDPPMDPAEGLRRVALPVHLVHGHGDTLIPYTESLRMAEQLEASPRVRVTVTARFAHSREQRGSGISGMLDGLSFVRTLGQVRRMV